MAKPRQECPGEWREVYDEWTGTSMAFYCPSCFAERPSECPDLNKDTTLADDTRERVADMRNAR